MLNLINLLYQTMLYRGCVISNHVITKLIGYYSHFYLVCCNSIAYSVNSSPGYQNNVQSLAFSQNCVISNHVTQRLPYIKPCYSKVGWILTSLTWFAVIALPILSIAPSATKIMFSLWPRARS